MEASPMFSFITDVATYCYILQVLFSLVSTKVKKKKKICLHFKGQTKIRIYLYNFYNNFLFIFYYNYFVMISQLLSSLDKT